MITRFDIEHLLINFVAGAIALAIIVATGFGLYFALEYHPIITVSAVGLFSVGRAYRLYTGSTGHNFRGMWFVYWFENEWMKIILLFIALWLSTKYI